MDTQREYFRYTLFLGLPSEIPTLPSLLSCLGGYSTAMAGKWHLGHAQHKMTPIGRGFDYFTGEISFILLVFYGDMCK